MKEIINGNCLEVLKELPSDSVHAIVTDPPYELSNDGKASPNRVAFEIMFPNYSNRDTDTFSEDELFLFVKKIFLLSGINTLPRELPTVPIGAMTFNKEITDGQINIKDEGKGSVVISDSERFYSDNSEFFESIENIFFKLTDFTKFLDVTNEIGTCFYSGGIGIGFRICPASFPSFLRQSRIIRRVLDDIGISDDSLTEFVSARLTTENKPVFTFQSGGGLTYDCSTITTIILFAIADICGSEFVRTRTTASGLSTVLQSIKLSVVNSITNRTFSFNCFFHNANIQNKGFMGKSWDGSKIAYNVELWRECLRVLKPGGHLLAFGGTRTYHRMACAIEDAGFEVRDMISEVFDSNSRLKELYSSLSYEQIKLLEDCFGGFGMMNHIYASGFPKSQNIGKAYDKMMGNEREDLGYNENSRTNKPDTDVYDAGIRGKESRLTKGTSPYEGQGSATKPAHEPIVMARKPLSEKTIVSNVLKHGTGGLDIDGCRIPTSEEIEVGRHNRKECESSAFGKKLMETEKEMNSQGRFPANIICTDDALNDGVMTKSTGGKGEKSLGALGDSVYGKYGKTHGANAGGLGDFGSKSRYFDIDVWAEKHGLLQFPKASKRERNEGLPEGETSTHPTVKPVHLMAWLIRLVSREGDIVLDPFAGSGTTGVACKKLNRNFILIEQNKEYIEIIKKRIHNHKITPKQPTLFSNE